MLLAKGERVPQITFIYADGRRRDVEAPAGISIMQAAVQNDIDAILGECGGAAACATCHIFVEPGPHLPTMREPEDSMLEATAIPRTMHSRLACQIFVSVDLAGLQIRLPETQI